MRAQDDKKILVWDFNTPVPIKYISDPQMSAIPSTAVDPTGAFFVGQSMDNTVVSYNVQENFKQMRRKTLRGHRNVGYACQLDFSPDGQFLASGDAQGRLAVWSWRRTSLIRTLDAHPQACVGVAWHPVEASTIATSGWDGSIKLWD